MSERSDRGRWDLVSLTAICAPVLTGLFALGVHADAPGRPAVAPTEEALASTTVVCPPGGDQLAVAGPDAADVTVRTGNRTRELSIQPGIVSTVGLGNRAAIISTTGAAAATMVVGRFNEPLASLDCRPPVFDQWFTGVGAGARHRSVLQLTNPDEGRAVVDVFLYGGQGAVDAPDLRGIAVRGGESRTFDLATLVPHRAEMAARVVVVRGRISANVLDTFTDIGAKAATSTDSLPSQFAPATTNLLLGIPRGEGRRTLVLANPGDTEGRATVKLVTPDSTFAPSDVDDIVLPPQSVVQIRLARVVRGAGTKEGERPLGLQVESTVPVTSGLVMFIDGDLTHTAPTTPLDGTATVPLPAGPKAVVLGGAEGQAAVTVRSWNARGKQLPVIESDLAADRALALKLRANARLITIEPRRTTASAVVVVQGDGGAIVRPRIPTAYTLVPDVGPGLR